MGTQDISAEYQLESIIADELDDLIRLRRRLHQIPELAYQEVETANTLVAYLSEKLPASDIKIESNVAGTTGVVVTLGAEKKGKCIAFRADMDALPIVENTGLPYTSQNEGRMHACGHDGHSAILAGLVQVLHRCKDLLQGPVKFVFQPAEEGGAGAKRLVQDGKVLEDPKVTAMFGLHGWPSVDLGQVGAVAGPCFASTNIFDITVEGQGGHAAFPHKTVDPMPVAAAIISALQTLVSRSTDPLDSCVLSICDVKGGSTYNVIPGQVVMRGTLRCFSKEHRAETLVRIEQMATSVAQGFGANATVLIKDVGYPVLVNDDQMTSFWASSAQAVLGDEALVKVAPTMGGEDFAYYAEQVPSCLWFLGVKDPEVDAWPQLHTPEYDFNDQAIAIGIRLQAEVALRYQSV